MSEAGTELNQNQNTFLQCSADRKVIEAGKRFVGIFVSALKTAQIYDPKNHTFLEHAALLDGCLREILRWEGEAALEVVAGHPFFNGLRLPADLASYSNYHFLIDKFTNWGMGKVWFEEDFGGTELQSFLVLFGRTIADASKSFEEVQAHVRNSGIDKIHIEALQKGRELRETTAVRRVGKQMYLKTIVFLKNMMCDSESQPRIQAKRVRRLVQTLVDSVINDQAYMLALTNIKNHYEYTLNHSLNVAVLAIALGYRLGLERTRLADLGIAALFHDIGKVNIPKEILTKPCKLTEEEFGLVKKHPFQGAEMLTRVKGLGQLPLRAVIVALEHHMGVDLSGYPQLSQTRHINLFSKIITVADVFDAMTTSRVYRKRPFRRDEALLEMMEESGKKFDPLLLKAFANMLGLYPIGTVVLLNTAELAVVVETNQNPANLSLPRVKLITDSSGVKIDGPTLDLAFEDSGPDGVRRSVVKALDAYQYGIDVTAYL